MGTAVLYLFLLLPVVAIAYVIWAYRKRTAEKEALSRERYANLVGAVRGATLKPQPQPATVAQHPAVVPQSAGTAAPAAAVPFLTPPENLLYHLLKAGLPGHEIFPHVSLAAVLRMPAGVSGPAEPPRRLARPDLDFVVCDKNMRVVAAIVMEGAAPGADFLSRTLASAGIRLVTVSAAALPRREQVRALIYGA